MRWTDDVKRILKRYPANRRELDRLENEIMHGPSVHSIKGKNGISRPTENAAIKNVMAAETEYRPKPVEKKNMYQLRIQMEVDAVEGAFKALAEDPNFDRIKKLADILYFNDSPKRFVVGAARLIYTSEITAKRDNRKLLVLVARNMGFI